MCIISFCQNDIYIYRYIYIYLWTICENPSTKCAKSVIPPPKRKVGFLVCFFWHPGFELPPIKSSYPPKNLGLGGCGYSKILKTKGTFFRGAYHVSAGIRPAAGDKHREKKTLGLEIFWETSNPPSPNFAGDIVISPSLQWLFRKLVSL